MKNPLHWGQEVKLGVAYIRVFINRESISDLDRPGTGTCK